MNTAAIISIAPETAESDEGLELAGESEVREFVVSGEHHGRRLDLTLASEVPEFSRSYMQVLIESACISINGVDTVRPSRKVKVGERIAVLLRPTPQSQAFRPQDIPINVIYRDDDVLVIDKPAGLVVHPAPGNWSGTLMNGLLYLDSKAALLPRAGIVHRLDKDTSGLMVVARTRAAMDALVQSIAQRRVSRRYLALSARPWSGARTRVVEGAIGRDPKNRLRMALVDLAKSPGKEARTTIELIDGNASGCLVQCTLHTGRTHQIRVHMASLGCVLAGDALYGGTSNVDSVISRQALHAHRLAFSHPVSGVELAFNSPIAPDVLACAQGLGLRYNSAER